MQFGQLYGTSNKGLYQKYREVEGLILPHKHEFKSIVGTGLSGATVVPYFAQRLHKTWAIVRKKEDSCHSSSRIEGRIDGPWIFMDDFISMGDTFRKVWVSVERGFMGYGLRDPEPMPDCVGVYLYKDLEWYDIEQVSGLLTS